MLCPLYTASFEISSRTRMASTEVVLKVYGTSQNKTHVLLFIHPNLQRKNLTAWADQVCLLGLQCTQRIPASKVSRTVSSADWSDRRWGQCDIVMSQVAGSPHVILLPACIRCMNNARTAQFAAGIVYFVSLFFHLYVPPAFPPLISSLLPTLSPVAFVKT